MSKKNLAEVIYKGKSALFNISNPFDHIQKHLKQTKSFYEIEMLEDIKNKISGKKVTIIDAGAYIGNHTIFFAMHCKANVIAFEPYKASLNDLKSNVNINGLKEKVTVYNTALGEASGKASIVVADNNNTGMTRVDEKKTGDVDLRTLDEVIQNRIKAIRVIKIDVEGMEVQVLKGAMETINFYRPYIYVEAFESERLREIIKLLKPLGYSIEDVFNSTPTYLFAPRRRYTLRSLKPKLKL